MLPRRPHHTAGADHRHGRHPRGPATVTIQIQHEWHLRTQINTMHRHWVLPSGDEARDQIRRRVLFPRKLERYAEGAGFDVLDMTDGSGTGVTGQTAYTVARYIRR
ncbi:hypothetical protein [Streptomyces broussonetiae]|uniref:hypothetical protein n=1 Tax=Streptomyces broussonetiae TaxID=2686304 RepID=UPI0035D7CCD3